ncbi:MAG: carboxypeptidase regulatory-like domain-containing protein [Planctomycetes bacterium]|nr:carboxypeptidase regulatory-like domain-containing protein [Planctomycetota bacterium]
MTAPSPAVRALQILAGLLAVAIAVLFVLWLRQEPLAPAPPPGAEAQAKPAGTAPGAAADLGQAPPGGAGIQAAERLPPPPTEAQTSALLYGSVASADGTMVKQGFLWLYRDGAQVGSESLARGTFAFAGLPPGAYRMQGRIADELPLLRDVQVQTPKTRLDLRLDARWLLAVNAVTPDGAPFLEAVGKVAPRMDVFRGLRAAAFREALPGDLPPSNLAEPEQGLGSFRGSDPFRDRAALPKQTVGVLTLPPGEPVHVALMLRNVIVAQQAVPAGQPEVTFTLATDALVQKLATARLRCVDPKGAPVAGARVAMNDAQTGGGGRPTGADGRIVLDQLKPGRLDLEIFHKDLRGPPVQIDVAAGVDLDLGDVTLMPSVKLELALDEFGGAGSVRVRWLGVPNRAGWRGDEHYYSAENGTRQTLSLFPGRHALFARGKAGVALLEVDTMSLPPQPLRLQLQRGAKLRVDCRAGPGVVQLELRTQASVVVHERELSGQKDYELELPPGDYVATITTPGHPPTQRTVSLGPAGTTLTVP